MFRVSKTPKLTSTKWAVKLPKLPCQLTDGDTRFGGDGFVMEGYLTEYLACSYCTLYSTVATVDQV